VRLIVHFVGNINHRVGTTFHYSFSQPVGHAFSQLFQKFYIVTR